ncbi:MAG: RNA 2',3'-cyclic phosphodiesterase [Anaerolineales bacterium]
MRTFLAIETEDAVKRLILSTLESFRDSHTDGAVRWVSAENIHLTLAFLGETPPERIAVLGGLLGEVASQTTSFPIRVGGIGAFPNVRKPRVIWLGVTEAAGALTALHARLWDGLRALGWVPEEKPFRPHLTLGRVRREAPPSDLDRLEGALQVPRPAEETMTADSIAAFRSDLNRPGPLYTRLAAAAFQKGAS